MARPAKKNCDYFPHFVKRERDLDYLMERFSIEGYYFFYRLREFLSDCDNWTYNIETDADMSYLCKQFSFDKSRVLELIDVCADNGIIDHDLWYKVQIIWQDELASYLQDAWKGRKTPPPEKPIVEIETQLSPRVGVSSAINPVSDHINPVSISDNTQRKGKEKERRSDKKRLKDIIENEKENIFDQYIPKDLEND